MRDHISADLLELYALGRVAEPVLSRIEEHLLLCEACRQNLEETENYLTTLRSALGSIGSIVAVHATSVGDVHLFTRQERGVWLARVVGRELDFGVSCRTQAEAEQRCRESFFELFPEHRCTRACRVP